MASKSPMSETQTSAGVAIAEQGQVILEGPDGVNVTMTPDAAQGTAHSLLSAAEKATQQQRDGIDTSCEMDGTIPAGMKPLD